MKIVAHIARIVLAIIYFVYGVNFFIHFWPAVMPPGKAGLFEGGLIGSGYFFQYMKAMQIASGLFLFINRYITLVAVILFPISLNIFLFHVILAPKGLAVAVVLFAANLLLLFIHRKNYKGLLTA